MYKQIIQIVLRGPEEDVEFATNQVEDQLSEIMENIQDEGTDITYTVSILDDPEELGFDDFDD